MSRYPRTGAVKTRLIPLLGAQGAADLHRELAAHCVARLRPLQATGEAHVEVHFDGGSAAVVRDWLGAWPHMVAQRDGDLGERLHAALSGAFDAGARAAAVVGSDCPSARAVHVRAALRSLDGSDVAIGPAEDGGYWLLAMTAGAAPRALPALFDGVAWGGPDVFEQTLERARAAGLRVTVAERLADVDRPEDVGLWSAQQAIEKAPPESVTVVIPAIDEAGRVGAAVRSALAGGALEVIVVDGGSVDGMRRAAEAAGARVLESPRGRASQMNVGAAEAAGDALVFLHADTRLPEGSAAAVCKALAGEGIGGGCFAWGCDDSSLAPLFTAVGRIRVAITAAPYGDQAIFLRRRTFEDLGGFPLQPVMEDWELVRRFRRLGRLKVLPDRAMTSARRYTEQGALRAVGRDLAVIGGYHLGLDPVALDAWRRR